jgi:DNA-binding NarL/FixJ family response regulator
VERTARPIPRHGGARAAVAEEWALLRLGLRAVLADTGTRVVADGPHALAVLDDAARLGAGIVVVGRCPDLGLDAAVGAAAAAGHVVVAVLAPDEPVDPLDLFALGASGVVSRLDTEHDLHQALWRVHRGERALSPAALALVGRADPPDEAGCGLTRRERAVLTHLARGASNRAIAEALFIGEETVKTHLRNIYAKLEVQGRRQAVGRAAELGLVG